MRRTRSLLLFLLVLVAVTACAAQPPAPTLPPTEALPAPTNTRPVTSTPLPPLPTQTPRPSLTPTATETALPTATSTPTPDAALAEVKLTALAWREGYDLFLGFTFPGPVRAEDYRVTLEDKEYKCTVLDEFPNRLYCWGQGAKVLAVAHVRVYPAGSDQPGFEKEVWVPYFNNRY